MAVEIRIKGTWHINAHETLQEDLIPTAVSLEAATPGWRAAATAYPQPILKTLGFQSEELALYEGRVRITMDLQPTNPATVTPLIPIALRLQACDDSVCLPPERHLLRVPTRRP